MTSVSHGAVPPRTNETNARSSSGIAQRSNAVVTQASHGGSAHSQPVMPNRTSISNSIARTLSRERSGLSRDQVDLVSSREQVDVMTSRKASRVTLTREQQLDLFDASDEAYRDELKGELARLSRDDSQVSTKQSTSQTKTRRDSL